MIKAISGFFTFLILLSAGAVAAAVWANARYDEPGPLAADAAFEVPAGASLGEITAKLEADGVIDRGGTVRDSVLFQAILRITGKAGQLKAGEYALPARASMAQIAEILIDGRAILYRLTAPEGLSTAEILARVRDDPHLQGELTLTPGEGELLPETYLFPRDYTRDQLVGDMIAAQRQALRDAWDKRQPGLPFDDPAQALTLASIVEKETALASERPQVASVFVNRLRRGMKLQSDPTVIYGLTHGESTLGRGLSRSELDAPTPWNTYTNEGLPPTPIANPGRASINAVMNPPETDYLYFVADGSGGHAFSRTLEEHERNVARWRRIERARLDAEENAAASGDAGATQ